MPHQFQCRFCPQKYQTVLEFIEHVKTHMGENEKTKDNEKLEASMLQRSIDIKLENGEIQSYICGEDVSVDVPSTQRQHEFRNKNEKIKKAICCDICAKTFSDRTNLRRHIKTVHENVKSHRCNLCSKSFGQKCHLLNHMINVHQAFKLEWHISWQENRK